MYFGVDNDKGMVEILAQNGSNNMLVDTNVDTSRTSTQQGPPLVEDLNAQAQDCGVTRGANNYGQNVK